MSNPLDVFFDNSPVFRLGPEAALKGIRPVAWFDSADAAAKRMGVRSGLPERRRGGRGRAVGKGRLFLFGPEITFRAQPHGTFKFLFNGIYLAARTPVPGGEPTARADSGKTKSRVATMSRPGLFW